MKDEEAIEIANPSNNTPIIRATTYKLVVRQSKKLGVVATKAFHDMKSILSHEIALPSPERFLGSFPHLAQSKKQKELDDAAHLKKIVKKSHQVLANVRTVFPVTLFPDNVIVDRTKLSITKREFFWTSNTISFQIEDILNVSCGIGPLFGSLTIASRVMSSVDHFQINYLWRGDAIFLKHLIQGHIIAKNNKLETDGLSIKEMIDTLCELGLDSDR